MQTGTIIHKMAKVAVPEKFVRQAIAKNRSILSCAAVGKDGDGKPEIVIDGVTNPTFDHFQEAQKAMLDVPAIFYLGNNPDGAVSEESVQPFEVLSDGQKNPLLIAFTDGDFSNYGEEKSAHSDDFFAMNKLFIPKIQKLYRLCHNDIDKLWEELNDPVARQEITNAFVGRGSLVLMPINGKLLTYGKNNPDWQNYEWGWTTNSYGYKEEKKKQEETATSVPIVSKKRKIFGAGDTAPVQEINTEVVNDKPLVSSKSTEQTQEQASGIVSRKAKDDAPKPDTSNATKTAKEEENSEPLIAIMLSPPIGMLKSKNQKKGFYDKHCATVGQQRPQNFKNLPPIKHKVPQSELTKFLEKGWKVEGAPGTVKVSDNGKAKQEKGYPERAEDTQVQAQQRQKDTAPKHIPTAEKTAEVKSEYKEFGGASELDNKINSKQEKSIEDWILKALDKKYISLGEGEIALDPKLIQSVEVATPTATDKAGLSGLEDTFGWSRDVLATCMRDHPDFVLDLLCQYRFAYIKTLSKKDQPSSTSHVKEPAAESKSDTGSTGIVRRRKVA